MRIRYASSSTNSTIFEKYPFEQIKLHNSRNGNVQLVKINVLTLINVYIA